MTYITIEKENVMLALEALKDPISFAKGKQAIKALEEALANQEQNERLHEAFSIKEQERWLSEIAEEVDDPTLTSFSKVAGCIRDLKEGL
jgi:hypothetical protein